VLEDRHAPDFRLAMLDHQSRRANNLPTELSHEMDCELIVPVQLYFTRDSLLANKDT
jgi:hypothetical protein